MMMGRLAAFLTFKMSILAEQAEQMRQHCSAWPPQQLTSVRRTGRHAI